MVPVVVAAAAAVVSAAASRGSVSLTLLSCCNGTLTNKEETERKDERRERERQRRIGVAVCKPELYNNSQLRVRRFELQELVAAWPMTRFLRPSASFLILQPFPFSWLPSWTLLWLFVRFRACRPLRDQWCDKCQVRKIPSGFSPAISSITVNRGIVIVKAGLISTMKSIWNELITQTICA